MDTDDDPFAMELNTALVRDRGIARAGLFRYDGDSVVSLVIDHCVADGHLTMTLLSKLLGYYTAATEGRSPHPVAGRGLEPSLDARFDGRYGAAEQLPAILERFTPAALPTPALGRPAPTSRYGVGHLHLDRVATTALKHQARSRGGTVGALLSGTVAAELSTMIHGPFLIAFPVDLRSRVQPRLRPDTELLSIGMLVAEVDPTEPVDSAELGRRISAQLTAGLDNALPQKGIVALKAPDAIPPQAHAAMLISNLGVVEAPPLPTGTELRSIRFGTTHPHPSPLLFASTTDGRLELDLVYDRTYFTDEQMTRLADGIHQRLTQFTGAPTLSTLAGTAAEHVAPTKPLDTKRL